MATRYGLAPFETHHERYEAWFDRHEAAYLSELLAVRALLPWQGLGLEIGVGTARFGAPLGIGVGVDPAMAIDEVAGMLTDTGYVIQTWLQTLSMPLHEVVEMEPFQEGSGNGGFVAVLAIAPSS